MFGIFKKVQPESQPHFVTLNEACEILPKERVISIHDAVKFLGSDPQTVESAIDLAISKDELETIAKAGTYVLAPVIESPLTLSARRANKIVSTHKGLRAIPRLVPSKFKRASPGYRLVQVGSSPQTMGYGINEQEQFLARQMKGQTVISAHALTFVTFLCHELLGLALVGGNAIRTAEKVLPDVHAGFRFTKGKALFDLVPSTGVSGVGAIGEVIL